LIRVWLLGALRIVTVGIAALFVVVHFTPLVPWITRQITEWGPEPRRGVLIVLGGEQLSDGTIGLMSYWRCVYAAWAYRGGEFTRVLVSGGASNYLAPAHPGVPPPRRLGYVLCQLLESLGVPGDKILVEAESSSTHRNAIESARLLAGVAGPFTLVTSDFHTYRAARCFRRAGIAVECWPAPDILKRSNDWRQRWHCAALLAEECVKIAYYRWKGWI
jgi:uncharacterized SAM-binding protein YcdF (DUF218 family)